MAVMRASSRGEAALGHGLRILTSTTPPWRNTVSTLASAGRRSVRVRASWPGCGSPLGDGLAIDAEARRGGEAPEDHVCPARGPWAGARWGPGPARRRRAPPRGQQAGLQRGGDELGEQRHAGEQHEQPQADQAAHRERDVAGVGHLEGAAQLGPVETVARCCGRGRRRCWAAAGTARTAASAPPGAATRHHWACRPISTNSGRAAIQHVVGQLGARQRRTQHEGEPHPQETLQRVPSKAPAAGRGAMKNSPLHGSSSSGTAST